MGLPESLGEVAHFLEAAGGGDGGDGLLGGCEQSGGFLEAVLSQVADRCRPDDMFEAAEAFALAYEGASCDPPDVELLGAVAVDVRQHLFEPFLFPQGSWGGAALPGGRPVGVQEIQEVRQCVPDGEFEAWRFLGAGAPGFFCGQRASSCQGMPRLKRQRGKPESKSRGSRYFCQKMLSMPPPTRRPWKTREWSLQEASSPFCI